MTLKVVPLDPDAKPHVGTLEERIYNMCYEYSQEERVTFAEIIGTLEIVKHDLIALAEGD